MIQRILRIGIAVLFFGLGIWQFIEGEIGNGIFWVLLTAIPVFLYLRHERILMALWYLRKQDMASAGKHLAAIRTPESTLIKGQLAYYYFLGVFHPILNGVSNPLGDIILIFNYIQTQ